MPRPPTKIYKYPGQRQGLRCWPSLIPANRTSFVSFSITPDQEGRPCFAPAFPVEEVLCRAAALPGAMVDRTPCLLEEAAGRPCARGGGPCRPLAAESSDACLAARDEWLPGVVFDSWCIRGCRFFLRDDGRRDESSSAVLMMLALDAWRTGGRQSLLETCCLITLCSSVSGGDCADGSLSAALAAWEA